MGRRPRKIWILTASTFFRLVSLVTPHQDLELSKSKLLLPASIAGCPESSQPCSTFVDEFLELSDVPQLRTTGIFDVLFIEKQNNTFDERYPDSVAAAYGRPTSYIPRQELGRAVVASPFTARASITSKNGQLWSLLKYVVPNLQTIVPNSKRATNRKAISPLVQEMFVKLLPWTIAHAKILARIIPTITGYVFGKFPQLLIPLYAAQRIYHLFYLFGRDWYTGRYLRIKFERMQRQYKTEYRIPECSRSASRFVSHLVLLLLIGRWVEWMLSLTSAPCKMLHGGCNIWCGTIWLSVVLGAGHAVGVAIAIWGGPMRIQVDDLQRPSIQNIRKPLRLVQWILDPDKWFRDIIARDRFVPSKTLKPFNPDTVLFPTTWSLLKILQMVAVVQHMQGPRMTFMMKKILVQQALSDEW